MRMKLEGAWLRDFGKRYTEPWMGKGRNSKMENRNWKGEIRNWKLENKKRGDDDFILLKLYTAGAITGTDKASQPTGKRDADGREI
jgi:hypothetical protein